MKKPVIIKQRDACIKPFVRKIWVKVLGGYEPMKVSILCILLLCIFATGCSDKQKQSGKEIIVAHLSTEYPELGVPVCYLNEQGDTVIPYGKYQYAGSDTIQSIGFVLEPHTPGWTTINNKGEKLFYTYSYDNGPDYVAEGYLRIVDDQHLMGFADTLGNIIIKPQFAFACPFSDNRAKVTYTGKKKLLDANGEHWLWLSEDWFYIDKDGNKLEDE